MPVAAPVTYAAARKTGSDDVNPSRLVDTAGGHQPDDEQLAPPDPVGQIAAGDDHRDVADRERRQRQAREAGAAAERLDDEQRHKGDPQPERRPPRREIGEQRGAVGAVAQHLAQRDGRRRLLLRRGRRALLRRLKNTTAAATSSATP